MASLIPDVSGSLRINTASAMNDYQAAMRNMRDAVASPGALIDKYLEREDKDRREAEEKKRYETELGFKQRHEGRVVDELNRAQATREAVQAQLNPEMYRSSRLGEVDTAIQQGLANLTPQDRAVAEQEIAKNYNREASGRYVLDSARNNVLADPTSVLSAQANQLNLRLKDPNSAEFKAAQQAEWDAAKRKMDYQSQKARGDAQFRYNLETAAKKEHENKMINAEIKTLVEGGNDRLKSTSYYKTLTDPKATYEEKAAALKKANSFIDNVTKFTEEELKASKDKEKEVFKENMKNESIITKTASYTANPKEFMKMYEDFKTYLGPAGTAENFMRAIHNVRWDDPKKSTDGVYTDFGLVDPDWSNIDEMIRAAKVESMKKSNKDKPVDPKAAKQIIDSPVQKNTYSDYPYSSSGLYGR